MSDSELPLLIQQMLQPGFYPHPVVEPIQLIQTHASYVLLTGDRAYKLKKPVNFGFLDYSTLKKRQYFCSEELRLNQRGAPDLYLDVVPIFQTKTEFNLSSRGEPVEYAVQMRQFPQENLFSSLFGCRKLSVELLEELGKVVANFHTQATSTPYIRSFGSVNRIRAAFDDNYQQTEKYIGGPQTQSQLEATRQYTDRFFDQHQDLFASRIQTHRIRECHGDLHLRNICLWQDKIQLFDCIEFSEIFRFVDVMYDVAFTVMDLEAGPNSTLANTFLNTYIEQTADWEGLQLLPLYCSRQAYVRAKVTSFLLDNPMMAATARTATEAMAARYYQLAWQYTKPRQGRLLLMAGLSGSGKSTVARILARSLGAIHIRSDAVRKHLAGIPLESKGDAKIYSPAMGNRTYDRLLQLGILLAIQGFPVILDAKYDRRALRLTVAEQAKAQRIPFHICHCTAPSGVLADRLQQRQDDISDATADLLARQQAGWESFTEVEQGYVKTVDTTQDVESQLAWI